MKRYHKTSYLVAAFVVLATMLSPVGLFAEVPQSSQKMQITGTVTDVQGEPLIGAAVQVKGDMTKGAITDLDGKYSISTASDEVLIFSCIGYKNQTVNVKSKNVINVILAEDGEILQETVVIGYGTVKKRDLTGSVSSLNANDLKKTNPVSVNQGLQGKLAGVNVSQSDGAPGAGVSIQIRGANSFTTSTEPLYIVDGIPFINEAAPGTDSGTRQSNNPLNSIAPQDIESVEVLKDASATAIYGSRAANGVIIITTKKGRQGKTKVEFSTNMGVSKVINQIDVLDAATYAEYRNEFKINGYTYDGKEYVAPEDLPYPAVGKWSGTTVIDSATGEEKIVDREYSPSPDDFRNGFYRKEGDTQKFYGVNWQDQIFHTAFSKEYNLTVSGGDEKGSYMYSGGMLDQQGVITNSYYKRYTARANNIRKVNDFVEIGSNISFSRSDNRLARTNSESYGLIASAIGFNPTRPVFDEEADSGYSEDFSAGFANPYLSTRTEKNILTTMSIHTSAYAQVRILPYLTFRQNLGYGYSYNVRNQYYNKYTGSGQYPTNGYAVKSDATYESLTEESLLTFDKQFGIHYVNAVAGITYEKTMWNSKSMNAKNFPTDATEDNYISAAIGDKEISSSRGKSQIMSYLFRVNYGLTDKYLFTASIRRDGSSRLANNRWANFYSGAFAWRLNEEDFIKNLNFFDDLKLRVSAGQTGNQGISAYATRSRFIAKNYAYDGSLASGMAEDTSGGPAAPDLKWETTTQYDLGLDVAFFKNRVSFTADAYYKNTRDLLQYKLIPMSSGFSSVACNYGNVENYGAEFAGKFIPVQKGSFSWSIDANIFFNRNKVYGLDADQFSDVMWGMESMFLRRNGYPIGTIYGYKEDGFYDNEAEVRADPQYTNASASLVLSKVGQIKYVNFDEDPEIDDRDKTIIGDTTPDFEYGFTNTFSYKNWTLSCFIQGTYGNDVLNTNLKAFDLVGGTNIPTFIYTTRWTAENAENAKWPRPDETYTRTMKASDRYVEDGSYLRCKNLSLGYRFFAPFKYVDSINIAASVTNLFTITKYSWYDPDVNAFGSDPSRRGVDLSSYPSARTFNISVQVSF